jgi:ATP-binding cassette subfamily C (CFTR/MRP) protein 10
MLISPLNAFPWVLNGLVEAWVSVQRLQAFLAMEDLDLKDYYTEATAEESRQQGTVSVHVCKL